MIYLLLYLAVLGLILAFLKGADTGEDNEFDC